MGGPRWTQHNKDPYRREVRGAELVGSMSGGLLFALRLDCGHTVYMSRETSFAPAVYRCRECIKAAIGDKPIPRRMTRAEAIVDGYVNGARVGVMDAACAALVSRGAP